MQVVHTVTENDFKIIILNNVFFWKLYYIFAYLFYLSTLNINSYYSIKDKAGYITIFYCILEKSDTKILKYIAPVFPKCTF